MLTPLQRGTYYRCVGFSRVLVLAILAAGCRQIAGLDDPLPGSNGPQDGSGSGSDSGVTDTPDSGPICFGNQAVIGTICITGIPVPDQPLSGPSLSSDNTPPCLAPNQIISGGAGLCVIAAGTIEVASGATAKFTGSRPVVLAATGAITIWGKLDASSSGGFSSGRGPGADYSGCSSPQSPQTDAGAAGGSFAALGGNGGTNGTAGTAGTAGAAIAATSLHGGCRGGSTAGGNAGDGGGAIYLVSNTSITVDATGMIYAHGSGGGTADNGGASGGCGGGSGGMIGLEAPMISLAGGSGVCANGGGGAQGMLGGSAQNGRAPTGCGPGAGGTGGGGGGNGGDGGAASNASGASGTDGVSGMSGGGGGGGSVGVIKIFGTLSGGGTISPPAS